MVDMPLNKETNKTIWPIDSTLPGATFQGKRGSGIKGNERVLRIPKPQH